MGLMDADSTYSSARALLSEAVSLKTQSLKRKKMINVAFALLWSIADPSIDSSSIHKEGSLLLMEVLVQYTESLDIALEVYKSSLAQKLLPVQRLCFDLLETQRLHKSGDLEASYKLLESCEGQANNVGSPFTEIVSSLKPTSSVFNADDISSLQSLAQFIAHWQSDAPYKTSDNNLSPLIVFQKLSRRGLSRDSADETIAWHIDNTQPSSSWNSGEYVLQSKDTPSHSRKENIETVIRWKDTQTISSLLILSVLILAISRHEPVILVSNLMTQLSSHLSLSSVSLPTRQVCLFYLVLAYTYVGNLESAVKALVDLESRCSEKSLIDYARGLVKQRKGEIEPAQVAYKLVIQDTKYQDLENCAKVNLACTDLGLRGVCTTPERGLLDSIYELVLGEDDTTQEIRNPLDTAEYSLTASSIYTLLQSLIGPTPGVPDRTKKTFEDMQHSGWVDFIKCLPTLCAPLSPPLSSSQ